MTVGRRVRRRAEASRSRSDHPGWRMARPSAAMISFLRSNACRIAPTSRQAGKIRVRNAGRQSRLRRAHHSPGLVAARTLAFTSSRSSTMCSPTLFDQGTTQVKTVASPRGEIAHGPIAAGEQQCLTEVEPDGVFRRARRSDVPFKPIRIVNRSRSPTSAGSVNCNRSSAKYCDLRQPLACAAGDRSCAPR